MTNRQGPGADDTRRALRVRALAERMARGGGAVALGVRRADALRIRRRRAAGTALGT
ncbi:hypothetical protein ABZ135_20650 [Streptomyces sp. NPDC006339]|uniref:hypothetical protein n=1 Tax=Streptomyces sp. NPDC006339 TaxID=3156755 RepID=UPI0033AB3289